MTQGETVTNPAWDQHERAVDRLRASYAAIAAGEPVRLAKPTTNLFRTRSATTAPGLDVSGLTGVIEVDVEGRVAEVQGMCTYEDLVDATLPHGLIPYVVPQLRTITLGGAVTGLGIESTSFRNGLPHESVLEMDVLTGSGEILTTRPGDELFDTFPNSYGSLGYATRLRISLEPVPERVALRHVRFEDPVSLSSAIAEVTAHPRVRRGPGRRSGRSRLRARRVLPHAGPVGRGDPVLDPHLGLHRAAGLLPVGARARDRRADMHDYLWRWDTDWFWCSGAFGAQHRLLRRLWPRRWRRSDVYMRLLKLDQRLGIADRLDRRAGRPERERVIQDIEVPLAALGEFLDWFDAEVGMRPVWLCPLVSTRPWSTYPLEPGELYVNVGFWGTVHVGPEAATGPLNRAIEAKVHDLGGHKSLYSEAFYDHDTFDGLYDGPHLARVKQHYDPEDRLSSPLREGSEEEMTPTRSRSATPWPDLLREGMPVRFAAYDGSSAGQEDADIPLELVNQRGLAYLLTAPGDLGMARAYVSGDLILHGIPQGNPYEGLLLLQSRLEFRTPSPTELVNLLRGLGLTNLKPPPPPPQEHLPRWRRLVEGMRHSLSRDAEVIGHHYDVSNAFYEPVLGPSMAYTCACYPTETSTLEEAQSEKFDLVARKLDLRPGQRLLDVGCGWGGMALHAAKEYGVSVLAVTLSQEQADWAKQAVDEEGLGDRAEMRHSRLPRRAGERLRRDQLHRSDRAHRTTQLPGVLRVPARAPQARGTPAQPLHHPARQPAHRHRGLHRPLRLPRRRADRLRHDHHRSPERRASRSCTRRTCALHYANTLRAWSDNLVENWDACVDEVGDRHRPGLGPLHGRLPDRLRAQRAPAAPGPRHAPEPTAPTGSPFDPPGEHPGPQYAAQVLRREPISDHLVRLVLGGPGLAGFISTGVPDEWVGLVVPGQFQSRYYTVRSWAGGELTLDVVGHESGWSPSWAAARLRRRHLHRHRAEGLLRDAPAAPPG